MTYNRLPADLAAKFRSVGLQVVELEDWHGNGRPASTGGFDADGTLCHHTGSYDVLTDAKDDLSYAKWLAFTGRSDLPAPLCNIALSAEGVVYLCSGGRANHAGKARASGTMGAGDGNELYVGIEAMNSGSQGWGKAQYDAYVLLCAAICVFVTGNSAETVRGHKETSVTGKWDPGMLDMDKFRSDVAAEIKRLKAPKSTPKPVPKPQTRVQKFLAGAPQYDVDLLEDAINIQGRTELRAPMSQIFRAMERLDGIKRDAALAAILEPWHADGVVRLGAITRLVQEGRTGAVEKSRDEIRNAIVEIQKIGR